MKPSMASGLGAKAACAHKRARDEELNRLKVAAFIAYLCEQL